LNQRIAIIGLGYVGLPLAVEFAKKFRVVGFDINQQRLAELRQGMDHTLEIDTEQLQLVLNKSLEKGLSFSDIIEDIRDFDFYIVTVPTPVDKNNYPDFTPLIKASEAVGKVIKKGSTIIFESTVYPGATEEICVPILEANSGLTYNEGFFIGYSPERINPGDKERTLTKIKKIVSGSTEEVANNVQKLYNEIIEAGTFKASSIKVAEAAKVIENVQRDINIAVANELARIFNKLKIDTTQVLEAAGTKWNFINVKPGLVGGHCIGVDPYYLTYKAEELGYHARVINSGRYINDSMGFYVAKTCVKRIIAAHKNISRSKVLVMGATFKEDVSDIRNSKVADIVKELKSFGVKVEIVDPHADSDELKHEYGFGLNKLGKGYDGVIVAVNHKEYKKLDEKFFEGIMTKKGIVVDVKGMYKNKIKKLNYWSL